MDPTAQDLQPGDVVGERYRVVAPIGSGGMGNVYRVQHTLMAKEMAMKLLRPELSSIPQIVERFEREAKSASRLDNVHIVRVTDFGQAPNGAFFLIMELLEGESLGARMHRQGPLPIDEALEVADQILEALEHAHANGVVHRDLKPENIMLVVRDGRTIVKILDFGLAKLTASAADPNEANLTKAGMVFGTPRYMSPEQAAGEQVDERSDLYAVGVILYEVLAGRPLFGASAAVELLTAHLTKAPPPLDLQVPDPTTAAEVERAVMRALAKHKADRWQSAREFREALLSSRARVSLLSDGMILSPGPRSSGLAGGLADAQQRRSTLPSSASGSRPSVVPSSRQPMIVGAAVLAVGLAAAAIALGLNGKRGVTQQSVAMAEEKLQQGDLPAVRAILTPLVADGGGGARAQMLLGHLSFADKEFDAAVAAYEKALELDPNLARDKVLTANAHWIINEDRSEKHTRAMRMVDALGHSQNPAAVPLFVELAQKGSYWKVRKHAYQALGQLHATDQLGDLVQYLTGQVERTERCEHREFWVQQLIQQNDPRAIRSLRKWLAKRSGFLGLENPNACIERLLREGIKTLEVKAPKGEATAD